MMRSNAVKNDSYFSSEMLFKIPLIPDEREYKESQIDEHIAWISANDSTSSLKTQEMVDLDFESRYFQNRHQEIEREKEWMIHQRLFQLEREKMELEQMLPEESQVNQSGPKHLIEQRHQQWQELEMAKRKQACEQDCHLIASRFNTLMSQALARRTQAEEHLRELKKLWEGERNLPLDSSGT